MHKYLLPLALLFTSSLASAQNWVKLERRADSLYQAKNYTQAGPIYTKAALGADFKAGSKNNYYNAACCYALVGKADSAWIMLHDAVKAGYTNFKHLKVDTDLESLHGTKEWDALANSPQPVYSTTDPHQARLITTDVQNFWKAHDLAQKDTANRYAIYRKYYIDAASPGMDDYFAIKVQSFKAFMRGHDKKAHFYAGIRKNTALVETQKKQMMQSFVNFKNLYPQARFPNIYFIIGNYTSGGTATEKGLLIGLDQTAGSPDVPVQELSLWERNNLGQIKNLPNLIAHELIHFEQDSMANDTTLLAAALREGMADFIAEMISGKTANERLQVWAKGREKQTWADFKKEMYLERADNWIGNADQETADKPADLGYWIGYQICKAYYAQAADKKQAIYDMLHVKNYRQFYEQSKVEQAAFLN